MLFYARRVAEPDAGDLEEIQIVLQNHREIAAAIRNGDAVPIQLSDVHSFDNTGNQPLEFLIVGVAREMGKDVDTVDGSNLRLRAN